VLDVERSTQLGKLDSLDQGESGTGGKRRRNGGVKKKKNTKGKSKHMEVHHKTSRGELEGEEKSRPRCTNVQRLFTREGGVAKHGENFTKLIIMTDRRT